MSEKEKYLKNLGEKVEAIKDKDLKASIEKDIKAKSQKIIKK